MKRPPLLLGLLVLSLAATAWVATLEDEASGPAVAAAKRPRLVRAAPGLAAEANEPAAPAEGNAAPADAAADLDLAALSARFARDAGDAAQIAATAGTDRAFGAKSWYVPPPPPPAAPPEPPKAPPLPFKFLGRYRAAGSEQPTCFVVKNDQTYAVLAGTTIEDTYRVEAVTDAGIEFTYLPLGQRQTLTIGSAP